MNIVNNMLKILLLDRIDQILGTYCFIYFLIDCLCEGVILKCYFHSLNFS